jgi:hypothetical protein
LKTTHPASVPYSNHIDQLRVFADVFYIGVITSQVYLLFLVFLTFRSFPHFVAPPSSQFFGTERRDLYFVLKASSQSSGISKSFNKHVPAQPVLDNSGNLIIGGNLYLLPGRYYVSAMISDAAHNQTNVIRGLVKIPGLKPEPLPELDRNLPEIEYSSEPEYVSTWLSMREWLPANSKRPLSIDIIANVSKAKHSPKTIPCPLYTTGFDPFKVDDYFFAGTAACTFDADDYEYVLQRCQNWIATCPKSNTVPSLNMFQPGFQCENGCL